MTSLARATIAKPDFEELHVLDVRPIRSPDGDQGLVVEALENAERILEELLRRALIRDDGLEVLERKQGWRLPKMFSIS